MINTELAKRLYEAGFPGMSKYARHSFILTEDHTKDGRLGDLRKCQFCEEERFEPYSSTATTTHMNSYFEGCPKAPADYSKPTLSELIENCGEGFGHLNKYDDVFDAESPALFPGDIGAWSGNTPEEAVANLYLALKGSVALQEDKK